MSLEPTTLEGARVRLVPLRDVHADFLWSACEAQGESMREVWRYFYVHLTSRDAMRTWIADAQREERDNVSLPFAIFDMRDDSLVGSTRLCDYTPQHRAIEIGATWLLPRVWRTSINTECKFLLLRLAFEKLDVLRVTFKTDARNERSQRAIERIGGVYEGTLRQHKILPDGFARDSVYYSILSREWPHVSARLQTLLST